MLKFKIYSFETLDVWKEARELVVKIYKITNHFPAEEKFGLVSQMRRAAMSISSNLAEGSSRQSLKDQARYSEMSYGSLMELLNQTILSFDLNFISEKILIELRLVFDSIALKLNGLRTSQLKRYEDLNKIKGTGISTKKSFNLHNPQNQKPISP